MSCENLETVRNVGDAQFCDNDGLGMANCWVVTGLALRKEEEMPAALPDSMAPTERNERIDTPWTLQKTSACCCSWATHHPT